MKSCILPKEVEKLHSITSLIQTSAKNSYSDTKHVNEEILDRNMEKVGFSLNGHGSTRRVYASPDKKYAVKFQIDYFGTKDGYDQNKNEIANFNAIPEKVKKFYNAPIAWDKTEFKWILFRYAKTYDKGLTYEACREIIQTIKDALSKFKCQIGLNDIGSSNVGEVGGNPVFIDYGYGNFS